jgi:hypothetical protein
MSFGPIELTVIKFPAGAVKGKVAPELKALVDAGTIRVIDILFLKTDAAGGVTTIEINDVDDDVYDVFGPLVDSLAGLLSDEDAMKWAAILGPNASAGLILFENTWAKRFVETVREAKGQVVFSERIPRVMIDELVATQAKA